MSLIFDSSHQRGALILSLAVGLLGMVAVAGYFAATPSLAAWGTDLTPMAPAPAIAFMALGFSAMLLAILNDSASRLFFAAAGIFAALVGLESLVEGLFKTGLHLNDHMLRFMAPGESRFLSGAMPPLSAASLLLLGVAALFLMVDTPRMRLIAVSLANAAGVAGSVVLLGYLYGSPLLYGDRIRPVALPAAVSIVAFAATLLSLAGPRYLPISVLSGHQMRARLLRFFLPVFALVLVVDGLLAHYLPRGADAPLTSALSVLIFTGASLFIVFVATRVSGNSIDEADKRRREAENKVATARAMFESLFESAPGSILVVDSQRHIVRVNAETERIFGYRRDELIGEPIEKLIPERFAAAHRNHTATYASHPKTRPMGAGLDLLARRKDGSEFPVDIMLGPLQSGSLLANEEKLVLSIVYDITERRRTQVEIQTLNRELERRITELEAVNNELEAFSYSVSHDLRAPLRAINGFSEMLAEDYGKTLDGEGNRLLRVIQDNTKQMGQLIDDLLAFSRLGRQAPSFGQVEMGELAHAVVDEIRAASPGRKLDIQIADLPAALGDRAMLRQVFVNLIANAVKFTRPRDTAHITIGVHAASATQTTYLIQDNGVGFDMQYADKIFGVFQRLHRSQEFEGTGVGLAIVQRVITRHNGKIWAESEVGAGTTFFFSLPRFAAEEAA